MVAAASAPLADARSRLADALAQVCDPEIPELSIMDLGIVREIDPAGCGRIVLTPTYSGCPAYEVIEHDVRAALAAAGKPDAKVEKSFNPPWTTEWLSKRARTTLKQLGIAPPGSVQLCGQQASVPVMLYARETPACPRCESSQVELLSEFGPTACKALYVCKSCTEPFEYFKPL